MGNNQSQGPDLERGSSPYNYHERVLQDARELCDSNGGGGYESDDQYFSAEEGDDSDRSVTPPRNRPESSSGEEFSDDSASENERGALADGGPRHEHETATPSQSQPPRMSMIDSQKFLSPANNRLLAVQRSTAQGNTSGFLEQDSIGPELDRSRWDVSTNCSSARTTRQSSQRSFTGNVSGSRSTRFSTSPFVPINSPPFSRNASLRLSLGHSGGVKRKANESVNEMDNDMSPKRKHVLKLSPNKRRLSMRDDSDSDDDNDRNRVIPKKKSHNLQQSEPPVANDLEVAGLKRSLKEKNDEDEALGSTKKGKFALRNQKLKVIGEKRSLEYNLSHTVDRSLHGSPEIKTFKADHGDSHSEISNPIESSAVVSIRPQGSAFQPLNGGSNAVTSEHEDGRVRHSITTTLKMGNDAVRNSLGKVLPIRLSHANQRTLLSSSDSNVAQASTSSPSVQASRSEINLSNEDGKTLRLRQYGNSKPADVTSASSAISQSRNKQQQTHDIDCKQTHSETIINTDNGKRVPMCKPNTVVNSETPSPFHNVVLTPPTIEGVTLLSNSRGVKRGMDVSVSNAMEDSHNNRDGSNNSSQIHQAEEMETDESQSGFDSMETHPNFSRQFIRASRSLTTAQRFKSFFTDGNLKSNIKTLFLKKKSEVGRESHPNTPSNQSAWSLYSSTSSSFFSQSPASNHLVFQSTSSPIDAVRSVSDNRINFSPNLSNVTNTSPLSAVPASNSQRVLRQSASPSSFTVARREPVRKSANRSHVATRTSPRLRRSPRVSGCSNTNNVSAGSEASFGQAASSSDEVSLLPQTSELQVLHFCLSQTLEVSLAMGDIAEELSAGIVNWTDGALTHNATECSRRICAKAGALMRAGCNSYIENKDGALEAPDVLTTPAGGRFPKSVKALLHVVSPATAAAMTGHRLPACLLEVNANCLRFASERLGLDSVSMPLIGEGELPTQLCAEAFIDAVLIFIKEKKPSSPPSLSSSSSSSSLLSSQPDPALTSVHLVTADANVTDQAAEAIQARLDSVKANNLDNVVAVIHSRYYGIEGLSLVMAGDGAVDAPETTGRAISGRPLVKRPRL